MPLILIRFLAWVVALGLPIATYAILDVRYPEETRWLAYALAAGGLLLGTFAKLPLRAGNDPTLFPVRAASGCSSFVPPALAAGLLWLLPHLPAKASQILALLLLVVLVLSFLAFATASRILRDTPKP